MNNTFNHKIPAWFWLVCVLAVVWNALGIMAYLMQVTMSLEATAELSEFERSVLESRPVWATAAMAVAVFSGFLGSFLLLLRSRFATIVLVISFLAVLTQSYHLFFIAKVHEVMSGEELVMPLMIPLIALLLIVFAQSSKKKGCLK